MKGKFIVFEGIDGSGKSTQLNKLADWLHVSGLLMPSDRVVHTKEPGFIPEIRSILKTRQEPLQAESELLLLLADRVQHVRELILPALERGDWVLCDRYISSTLAYQGYARNLGVASVQDLLSLFHFPEPDLEIYVDIPVDESLHRSKKRSDSFDRFEAEGKAFLNRVKDGYDLISPYNRVTVDGCQKVSTVHQECSAAVFKQFNQH